MIPQTTEEKIAQLRQYAESIRENLKYADHGAYGQDLERLRKCESEIATLELEKTNED